MNEPTIELLDFIADELAEDGWTETHDGGTLDRTDRRNIARIVIAALDKRGEVPEYHYEPVTDYDGEPFGELIFEGQRIVHFLTGGEAAPANWRPVYRRIPSQRVGGGS